MSIKLPVNNNAPLISRVSALVEKSVLPLSPVALNAPDTDNEPVITTD